MTKPGGKRRSWTGEMGPTKSIRKRNRGRATKLDKVWARMRLSASSHLKCDQCKEWTEAALNVETPAAKRGAIARFPHVSEVPVEFRSRSGWALDADLGDVVAEESADASFRMLPDSGLMTDTELDLTKEDSDMPRWKERTTKKVRISRATTSQFEKNWQRATEHAKSHDCDDCRRWKSDRRAFMRRNKHKRAHLKRFPHPDVLTFGQGDEDDVLKDATVGARMEMLVESGLMPEDVELQPLAHEPRALSKRLARTAERATASEIFTPAKPPRAAKPRQSLGQRGRPRKTLANEVVDKIVEMYTGGSSRTAICVELSVSPAAVTKVLGEHGVALRSRGRARKPIVNEVIHMYARGMSMTQIATDLGVAPSTVHNVLKRHGIARRKQGGNVELSDEGFSPERQSVVDLRREGLSGPQIAERLGMTPKRVYKHMGAAKQKLGGAI